VRIVPLRFSAPDALALGTSAPLDPAAAEGLIRLLDPRARLQRLPLPADPVLDAILVRARLLNRVPASELADFLFQHVRPLIAPEDVLLLDVSIKVELSGSSEA